MNASVAAQWQLSPNGQKMICKGVEYEPSNFARMSSFISETRRREFGIGEGLPGQVWADISTVWLPNTVGQPSFPRTRVAASAGLCREVQARNGGDRQSTDILVLRNGGPLTPDHGL